MADNAQKTPFASSLNRWGHKVAKAATNVLGQSVPASLKAAPGPIVEVNYEVKNAALPGNVQMPVLGSRYYRAPFQAGEKGMAIASDYYMGGMSGLGGGTADLSQHGNLATQAWTPVGHTDWPSVDPNMNVVTGGPSGVLIRNSESPGATFTMTGTAITLSCGGHTIVINSTGVVIDGIRFLTHRHTGVTVGGSPTQGPID